jgi:hypothetical protein
VQGLPIKIVKGLEAFAAHSSQFAMSQPGTGGEPRHMGLIDAAEVESQGGAASSDLQPDAKQACTPTLSLAF